ncbi:MAG: FecR family protein [Steroidobacteraceae bacterium]
MGIEDGQDEQLIARAVRGAMRLPPASPEARARVLAAVEAEWRTTLAGPEPVAPRRRRVPLALAASLLVGLLAVGAAWQARVSAEPALAVAEVVQGRVELERARPFGLRGAALVAAAGVPRGRTIETGADGATLLRLGDGLTLRLAARSRLRFESADRAVLETGLAYVDADPRLGRQPLSLSTPFGTVSHLGTQYAVGITPAGLEVAVREGRVQLVGGGAAAPLQADAGQLLSVGPRGAAVRTTLRPDDARWSWLAALPTPFTLEGATLSGFLDWYARESGRAVRFRDADEATRAATVRLSGSVAGMAPDEALRVVAASAGLELRRDEGGLLLALP